MGQRDSLASTATDGRHLDKTWAYPCSRTIPGQAPSTSRTTAAQHRNPWGTPTIWQNSGAGIAGGKWKETLYPSTPIQPSLPRAPSSAPAAQPTQTRGGGGGGRGGGWGRSGGQREAREDDALQRRGSTPVPWSDSLSKGAQAAFSLLECHHSHLLKYLPCSVHCFSISSINGTRPPRDRRGGGGGVCPKSTAR